MSVHDSIPKLNNNYDYLGGLVTSTSSPLPLAFLGLILSCTLGAQDFEPGYIDPNPILQAASAAIGEEKLSCVSISGSAYSGMVGQQYMNGYDVDWPRGEILRNYTRIIDWDNVRMTETFDREPGNNPASWKYGLGWYGGTPIQENERQIFSLNNQYAWHQDGQEGQSIAARPNDAERWQLDMWLNPHGFLKAARLPGANPRATWRWELGEMGRDGATVNPEKVSIVSITVMKKYRVDATINSEYLLQRIHTWVPDPVLGDTNYEHEFSNSDYIDLGNGIKFPTNWHHHTGWDDNYQAQSVNAGHNAFGGRQHNVIANTCPGDVEIPAEVADADFPETVDVEKLSEGVFLFGGSSHNSVVIEFDDYIAVVEAPLNEKRNLAVIDKIVELIPGKPIRFLINTHQHHDHIGGLRTYMHIGATIITHWKNYDFYTNDVLNYAPRTLDPDMVSLWPPTELAEGYQYETVRENYALSDGQRLLQLSYVHPLSHSEGMLVAYLPEEKLLIEADLFDSSELELENEASPANQSLYNHVRRLGLDVETIVPIHGEPTEWRKFTQFLN